MVKVGSIPGTVDARSTDGLNKLALIIDDKKGTRLPARDRGTLLVGTLVTRMNPAPRPVDNPSGAVPWKKVLGTPEVGMRMMVVPVPCVLLKLLKFETRISPCCSRPVLAWKLSLMNATP